MPPAFITPNQQATSIGLFAAPSLPEVGEGQRGGMDAAGLKGFQQLRRPGGDAREVRLVAAEAEDDGAEKLGHGLVVAVVGGFEIVYE